MQKRVRGKGINGEQRKKGKGKNGEKPKKRKRKKGGKERREKEYVGKEGCLQFYYVHICEVFSDHGVGIICGMLKYFQRD